MFRHFTSYCLLAAGLLTTPLMPAQPPERPTQAQDGVDPSTTERISVHIAAAIRESLPVFKIPEKNTEPAPQDDSDLVVLPKMVIHGPTTKKPSEHELASKAELAKLLRELHPGASPPLERHMPNYASLMRAEDERLGHIAELEQMADLLQKTGEEQQSRDLKDEIASTFLRSHDALAEAMDRSANGNRR